MDDLLVAGTPDTIAGWKALAAGQLSSPCCAFHRNVEISARYSWLHTLQPAGFKWAAMAAIASHHVRLALFPLRLSADRTGYVELDGRLGSRRLMTEDVHIIRATNNAIFNDIVWAHLAYAADEGIGRLRRLLGAEPSYAPMLRGFESIERGRALLASDEVSADSRRLAADLVWRGNVQLLEHEQRALVQPNFDRLSCAFARLVSIGAATNFEVRGLRYELAYFTSFYGYALTRGLPTALRARTWPRITRFEDRWAWLVTSVVPRFRKFDATNHLLGTSLRRIRDDAAVYARMPCVPPMTPS